MAQWRWCCTLVIAVLCISGAVAPTPAYYVIADDSKAPGALTGGMPMYRKTDWPVTSGANKPTVIVAVPVRIPISLSSCTELVFDVPLQRTLGANASMTRAPSGINLFIWTRVAPNGIWSYAGGQATESMSLASPPWMNLTWQPDRPLGVYRWTYTLRNVMSGGVTFWLGMYFDQPLAVGGGNAAAWLGGPTASFPFIYMDMYGNFAANNTGYSQMQFKNAPISTQFYTTNAAALSNVALTIYMLCSPLVGGPQPPTSFVSLPPVSWGPAGSTPPPPAPPATPPSSSPRSSPPQGPPSSSSSSSSSSSTPEIPTPRPPPFPTQFVLPTGFHSFTNSPQPPLFTRIPPVVPGSSPTSSINDTEIPNSPGASPTPTEPGFVMPPLLSAQALPYVITTIVLASLIGIGICVGLVLLVRHRRREERKGQALDTLLPENADTTRNVPLEERKPPLPPIVDMGRATSQIDKAETFVELDEDEGDRLATALETEKKKGGGGGSDVSDAEAARRLKEQRGTAADFMPSPPSEKKTKK